MKIYTFATSPAAKRVRICAAELGVPVTPAFLDPQKAENRSADYLALNPMGKVPTLVDGDLVLWESSAILWHMTQKNDPQHRLWPADTNAQADAMRWLFFGACHMDPYYTTLVVERFIKARQGEPADEAAVRGADERLKRFLPVLDEQLSGHEYVSGRFGLPDITLGCTIELSGLVNYDLGPYPNVSAWLARLHARPTWSGASPKSF
jgi:glutathione S-transferase